MSSIAPSSMFVPFSIPTVGATPPQGPSRVAAAALLALASLPAVLLGGRPLETFGALGRIVVYAISQDLGAK